MKVLYEICYSSVCGTGGICVRYRFLGRVNWSNTLRSHVCGKLAPAPWKLSHPSVLHFAGPAMFIFTDRLKISFKNSRMSLTCWRPIEKYNKTSILIWTHYLLINKIIALGRKLLLRNVVNKVLVCFLVLQILLYFIIRCYLYILSSDNGVNSKTCSKNTLNFGEQESNKKRLLHFGPLLQYIVPIQLAKFHASK